MLNMDQLFASSELEIWHPRLFPAKVALDSALPNSQRVLQCKKGARGPPYVTGLAQHIFLLL